MDKVLKIGSRGSPLALKQVGMVQAALASVFPDLETEVVVIQTSGDWKPEDGDVRLSEEQGGKRQFAKEIEEALLDGRIDAGVHSMKDMDSQLPGGLVIDHMLRREDPRDVLLFSNILADSSQLEEAAFDRIPHGAIVGTASVRRAAFLLAERPDLKVVPFRGNVHTRIEKLHAGGVDATLLALAGLKRLGLEDEVDVVLEIDEMIPCAGQGAVGVELRREDADFMSVFSQISHLETVFCVKAERAALKVLDGTCHTPIGAHAVFEEGQMFLRVRVCSLDGRQSFYEEARGDARSVEEAQKLGADLGARMKGLIPHDIFD